MCLSSKIREYNPPDQQIRVGYKVFRRLLSGLGESVYAGRIMPEFKASLQPEGYTLDTWYKAEHSIIDGPTFSYVSGFHIFLDFESAKRWTCEMPLLIGKVEYKGLVVEGIQSIYSDHYVSFPIHVAQEMKIVEIINEGDYDHE